MRIETIYKGSECRFGKLSSQFYHAKEGDIHTLLLIREIQELFIVVEQQSH